MATNNTGIDFDADVALAVADLTDTFTHSGTTGSINAVISQINRGSVIDGIEGPSDDIAFEIVVQTSLLTTRPVTDENVTISGTDYRIIRVETDEADAALNLICAADTA